MSSRAAQLLGFRALGRQGELGVVVDHEEGGNGSLDAIVVKGGASEALTYFIPYARVLTVAAEGRTVVLDVDIADFVPTLDDDGTVELRLA